MAITIASKLTKLAPVVVAIATISARLAFKAKLMKFLVWISFPHFKSIVAFFLAYMRQGILAEF